MADHSSLSPIGKHRDLQRVTVPYAKLLGVVVEEEAEQGDAMDTQTTV